MGGMGKNSSFGSTFDWGYEFYAWVNDEPTDECNIILDEAYAPVLAVPPQMYSIDPLWTSCGLGLQGLYDPPTALTAVATEASVTIPTAMQTTTAEPSPAISSAAPQTSIAFTFATTSTQDPVLASSQTQIPKPGTSTAQHSTAQQQSSPTQDPDAGSGSAATDPASAVSTSILQTTIIIVPSNSLVDPSSGQGQASQPVGSGVSSQEPAVASTAGDPTTQTQPQAEVSSAPIQDPTDPAAATTIAFSDSQPSSQAATTANAAGPGEANTQAAQGGQGSTQDPHATAATSSTKLFFTYAGSTRSADQSGSAPDPDGTTIVLVSGANSGDPGVAPSAGSQEGVPATVTYEADGVQASATTVTYVAGSDTFTVVRATSASNVYGIGGTTVREGGAPAIVQGTTYSVGSTGVVVNGQRASAVSSQPFGSGSGASLTIVGVGGSSGAIAVHGATLYNGGSATVISGVTLSAGSGGLVIDHTRTVPVAIPSQQSQERGSAAVLTLGPQAYTAAAVSGSGKGVVLGGETLSPGGPAVSIKGHTVSEGSGVLIVDGTRTVALSASSTSRPEAIVTLGSETLTAEIAPGTGSAVVIGGHTIPSGSETTINGVDVSAGDSGLVIGGTKTIGFSPPAPATTASPKFVTIGGQTLTVQFPATIGGDAVINGITMTVGERTTLNGIVVNEGSAGVVFSALAASGSANRSSVTTSSSAGVLPSVLTTVTQDSPTRSAGRPSGSTSTKSGAWRVGTAVEEREGWMVGLVGVVVILLLF
ncbi:putative glutamine--tRNA ligase [Teratosphaeria destructans]|uniref:Glutamine--tRNA ligase n=1 Tax=Teratosphaeria destructans TaxID=418781 RepID=A0A9W7T1P9_9PEZI|nr:putative glutamine--tRNA ligase [Teratosphaeria destructans]